MTTESVAEPIVQGFDLTRFDHFSQEHAQHPERVWAALRAAQGLPLSELYGGFRVVARYDEICEIARNQEVFSSNGNGDGVAIPPHDMPPLIPEEQDPPLHNQYRKLLNASLGPTTIAKKDQEFRKLADELLADIGDQIEFDFCELFATRFPQLVALRAIGFDDADRENLSKWFHDLTHLRGIDPDGLAQAGQNVFAKIGQVIAERRQQPSRDDFLSLMIDGEVDGRPMRDDEIMMYVALLLFGGLDTTASAIAGAFYFLAKNPDARARLIDDEFAMDIAIEEIVRWTSPIQAIGRTVTQPTEVAGCPMSPGDKVLLVYGSGNRDESVFEQADEVVLDRSPNRHLAFGVGPHRCMGSHLAKLMVKIAIEQGLGVLGDFELVDESRVRWAAGEARGIVELPLRRKS